MHTRWSSRDERSWSLCCVVCYLCMASLWSQTMVPPVHKIEHIFFMKNVMKVNSLVWWVFLVSALALDFFVGKEELWPEVWGNFVAYEGRMLKVQKSKREDLQRELSCFLRNCRCFWGILGRHGCTPGKNSFSGKCFHFHSSKHRYLSVILRGLLKWAKHSQFCNKKHRRTGAFPLGWNSQW